MGIKLLTTDWRDAIERAKGLKIDRCELTPTHQFQIFCTDPLGDEVILIVEPAVTFQITENQINATPKVKIALAERVEDSGADRDEN